MIKNKKGFEFSFGWLFAMMVGAVILVLAVYAAVRLISGERGATEAESAKQLEIILTPIETGFEEGKAVAPIKFALETRVYNNCTLRGPFGEQRIATATSSTIGSKWGPPGIPASINNKYIFSPSMLQGKQINVFSKTFKMPFKIGDLIFLWTDKYCFVTAPNDVKDEINSFGLKNINTTDSAGACEKGSKKVCFYSSIPSCDMTVNPDTKTVEKNGTVLNYEGSLMYGAIFSDASVYECEVARLMRRGAELANLYSAKSTSVSARGSGCSSNLQGDLAIYSKIASEANSSQDLSSVLLVAKELDTKNSNLVWCKLWGESL